MSQIVPTGTNPRGFPLLLGDEDRAHLTDLRDAFPAEYDSAAAVVRDALRKLYRRRILGASAVKRAKAVR